MRLADLLSRLVAAAPKPNSITQGANDLGRNQAFHLHHPNGAMLATLKTIAEEAPTLLQELMAALPKADLAEAVREIPTGPTLNPTPLTAPGPATAEAPAAPAAPAPEASTP